MSSHTNVNRGKSNMKEELITSEEARARLRTLCHESGGVSKLARIVGIGTSSVSHQLHGSRPIQGKLARYMGLTVERETTLFYRRVWDQ